MNVINRHVVRQINQLVEHYCINTQLTLPGFHAFLRDVMNLQRQYPDAFEESSLQRAVNDLIAGFWEKVKPSLYDVTHGVSDDMSADMRAINGIAQLLEENPAGPSNDLDPRPPFQKTIQFDLQQALGSRPTPTPGPRAGG